jgi:hypothetical protein
VAERPALPERAPGLGDDVVAGVEAAQRRVLKVEVELDLVHGRDDVRLVEEPLQVRHLEVGDPDGVDSPVRVRVSTPPCRSATPSCYSTAMASTSISHSGRPSGDGDLGGGRRLLPEGLLSDRDQLLAVPDVGEEGGDLHDVCQRPSARLDMGL